MNDFHRTPQKRFEAKMTPYIDDVYRDIFGSKLIEIFRNDRSTQDNKRVMFMDVELAIDTHLTLSNGSVLTFQEKSRRNSYLRYMDFTFEYMNDPATGEHGEWFKLASQLYFYGFANRNEIGYAAYWIINVAKMRTALLQKYSLIEMEREFLKQNPPPAKANFFAIPLLLLESFPGVVLHKGSSRSQAA